jgi:hypothetical protein
MVWAVFERGESVVPADSGRGGTLCSERRRRGHRLRPVHRQRRHVQRHRYHLDVGDGTERGDLVTPNQKLDSLYVRAVRGGL